MIIRMTLEVEIEQTRLKGLFPNLRESEHLRAIGSEVAEQIEDRYGAFVREVNAHSVRQLEDDCPAPDVGGALTPGPGPDDLSPKDTLSAAAS